MHFLNPALDGELMAELRDTGVLTPDLIDRIDAAMGRPESGTLNDFLLAGASLIPEQPWISWLVRRHGCHRFGRVRWQEEAAEWARAGLGNTGNLPFRRGPSGCVLVAVLRPDSLEETARDFPGTRLCWAAGSLTEIQRLHVAWRRAAACPAWS